jgi:hypothetical protein
MASANTEKKSERKKKKKMTINDKLYLLSMHAPHIQGEDVETKLKPSRNGFFGY